MRWMTILSAGRMTLLGASLGLGESEVAGVEIFFAADGSYAGFDEAGPLAQAGGKRRWIESSGRDLPRPIALVGDGATDLEARPAVDAFIAFTGVVRRTSVAEGADFVIEGESLDPLLPLVLQTTEAG